MKSELPKFLLITDPYNSLEGRILVLKTEFPVCIFELNRPDEPTSKVINLNGKDYYVMIRTVLDMQFAALNTTQFKEVARWYYHSQSAEAGLETDL